MRAPGGRGLDRCGPGAGVDRETPGPISPAPSRPNKAGAVLLHQPRPPRPSAARRTAGAVAQLARATPPAARAANGPHALTSHGTPGDGSGGTGAHRVLPNDGHPLLPQNPHIAMSVTLSSNRELVSFCRLDRTCQARPRVTIRHLVEEGDWGRTPPPPGYWPTGSPGPRWCRWSTDARLSSGNVRLNTAAAHGITTIPIRA